LIVNLNRELEREGENDKQMLEASNVQIIVN